MSNKVSIPSMQDLLEAGVHFGHQTRRLDPRMNPYIFGARGGVHIINLELSEKNLQEAADFVYDLGKSGKTLLFVATKKQSQPLIAEAARRVGAPFVNFRWIGGLLTNFEEVRRNIKKLLELRELQQKGELSHYTKKERLLISRRLEKFDLIWGGVSLMESLPDAVFVADSVSEKTAIAESLRIGIPVVGIADTNSNPQVLTYAIPGNDDATKSIKTLIDAVTSAYEKGLKDGDKTLTQSQATVKETKEEKKDLSEKDDSLVLEDVAVAEEEIEKEILDNEAKRVDA